MTDEPLFSLIMANYNSEPFLHDAITSLLSQTYKNWELVAVDDCSTDHSYSMLLAYAEQDARIRVFRNEKNSRLGYTRRRSASFARGELCACFDPDDALTPDAVELMVREHKKRPDAAIIGSRRFICNEHLKVIDIDRPLTDDYTARFRNNIDTPWMINHFAAWKKAFYDKTEGFDPVMPRSTDQDLYLKMEETGPVYFLNKPLYYYRRNRNSVSLNKNIYKTQLWHIYTHINACKRRGLDIDNYDYLIRPAEGGFLKKTAKAAYRFAGGITSRVKGRIRVIKYRIGKY